MIIENDHMAQIARSQQETSDLLNKRKHKLMQTQDKSSKEHSKADAERQQMEIALDEIRTRLITAKYVILRYCVYTVHQFVLGQERNITM